MGWLKVTRAGRSLATWSESLGSDLAGRVSGVDERGRHRLNESAGTADVDQRPVSGRPADPFKEPPIDSSAMSLPPVRYVARERQVDLARPRIDELVSEDHVIKGAGGVEQSSRALTFRRPVTQHRAQRHDS